MKETTLLLPVLTVLGILPALTGEQVVEIIRQVPAIVTAITALVVAFSARNHARRAREQAADAAEQAKEAAKEQIHFALRAAARRDELARRGVVAVRSAAAGDAGEHTETEGA